LERRQGKRAERQKGDTDIAAPSQKRTSGHPTASFQWSEAKNPLQAFCKPLARYGAMEGALARGLLYIGEGSNSHVAAGSIPDVA
jgi:hypothetical protein